MGLRLNANAENVLHEACPAFLRRLSPGAFGLVNAQDQRFLLRIESEDGSYKVVANTDQRAYPVGVWGDTGTLYRGASFTEAVDVARAWVCEQLDGIARLLEAVQEFWTRDEGTNPNVDPRTIPTNNSEAAQSERILTAYLSNFAFSLAPDEANMSTVGRADIARDLASKLVS